MTRSAGTLNVGTLNVGTRSAGTLNVAALGARARAGTLGAAAACVGVAGLAAALYIKTNGLTVGTIVKVPLAVSIALAMLLPALLVWLWRQPVRGVYVLFAAAVLQETQYPGVAYPDDVGLYIPFFQDVATWTGIKGLSFSVAELFMLIMFLIWPLKALAERRLRFRRGTLMLPVGLYLVMVLVAEAHGLGSGGDFRLSLWEIRSQIYMVVAYVLVCNLIETRRQVNVLAWILLLGAGVKGVQGTWRFLITLHGSVQGVESLFPHEQSFFFNAFLTLGALLFLYGGSPLGGSTRLKRATLFFLPFVLVASLANQRRAAILALAVAAVLLLLTTAVVQPRRRRAVGAIVLALAVALPPYYLAYANKSGLLAEPARAIASAFKPDARDASSNLYRVNEDKDIMATMRTSPIIGYGYGKVMLTPYPLADISNSYIFWNVMPHDSILWVWMRLGTVGYLLLWCMIAAALIQAARLARRLIDPYLQGLAVLVLLLIVQEVIFGYLDLQWANYRNLIVVGVLFAVLGTLKNLAEPFPARASADVAAIAKGTAL